MMHRTERMRDGGDDSIGTDNAALAEETGVECVSGVFPRLNESEVLFVCLCWGEPLPLWRFCPPRSPIMPLH